ncbi:MAG: tRNA (adenosine(37)-N6)-threonylcarbamoyltransferase complex dimerization subunit type 1 TsaB [Halioglobus sp.]
MTGILAIETSTDACSVALAVDNSVTERHEVVPRRHNQRLFQMLDELLGERDLGAAGVTHIAYGSGPGSFTGLRVAVSAVQGLAFASGLPVVAVPSLAVVAQTALCEGLLQPHEHVLATIDASVDELYAALYRFDNGLAVPQYGPLVAAPEELPLQAGTCKIAVGSGCAYAARFPQEWAAALGDRCHTSVLPRAAHMIPLALSAIEGGDTQSAMQASPVYVRDQVSWKKLAEQGKAS